MTTYIGLDLGQLQDYSALAVVREIAAPAPAPVPTTLFHPADLGAPSLRLLNGQRATAVAERDELPALCVTYLHRWPLGTKYAKIVEAMGAFLASELAGDRPQLTIDGTGVGVAVLEMFDAAGIGYEAVSIHGGQATTREGRLWRVAKKTLVGALQVPLQDKRLTIEPPTMPFAAELRAEMGSFTYKITAAANETYAAWREADHDDLVLALAIACWRATRPRVVVTAY